MKLTDKQIADYFKRSFAAVDGLWFMKIEDKLGFEEALEYDRLVWEIFPKIQARELKSMLNLEKNPEGLRTAFSTLLDLEGFTYHIENDGSGFKVIVTKCPWHENMIRSGRENLSAKVGEVICRTEYSVWAAEYGGFLKFSFESPNRICAGGDTCILCFKE